MARNLVYYGGGYLYVSTDWHGDYSLFQEWIEKVNEHIKRKKPSLARALILGDITNPKKDEDVLTNGDIEIINAIERNTSFPINFLMGNHERGLNILANLKKEGHDIQRYLTKFNALTRIKPDYLGKLEHLPTSATTENGIILTHAGLPAIGRGIEYLFEPEEEDIDRITEGADEDFDPQKIQIKLNELGIKYSISGHTPLARFIPECQKSGMVAINNRRIIFTSNDGYSPGRKTGLCINLQKDYQNLVDELKADGDITYLD